MKRIFYSIKRYFKKTDKILILLVLLSSLYGVALIYSATYNSGSISTAVTQLLAIALGLACAVVISLVDYESLSKLWPFLAGITVSLMILTLFFGVGPQGSDNKAWLMIPGTSSSIQPSEFLKLAFIITFSRHLQKVKDDINNFKNVIMLGLHALVPFSLVLLTKDDGSATVFLAITVSMLFAAGLNWKYMLAGAGAAGVIAPLIWFFYFDQFQRERFLVVFNPEKYDPTGLGQYYQQLQSKIAIGSGQVVGQGYLNGARTQASLIPKDHNDFILAVSGEELGFLGILLVLILLGAIFFRILWIGKRSHFNMGKLICVGIFAQIAFQAVINIAMCLALFPVVGVTLPFFSAGGSSILTAFVSIGLILSVYTHNEKRPALDDSFR